MKKKTGVPVARDKAIKPAAGKKSKRAIRIEAAFEATALQCIAAAQSV